MYRSPYPCGACAPMNGVAPTCAPACIACKSSDQWAHQVHQGMISLISTLVTAFTIHASRSTSGRKAFLCRTCCTSIRWGLHRNHSPILLFWTLPSYKQSCFEWYLLDAPGVRTHLAKWHLLRVSRLALSIFQMLCPDIGSALAAFTDIVRPIWHTS